MARERETAHNIMTFGVELKFYVKFLLIEIQRQESRVDSNKENHQKVNGFLISVWYHSESSGEFSAAEDIQAEMY